MQDCRTLTLESSVFNSSSAIFMAALWNRAGHYIFILRFLLLSSFFFFFFFFLIYVERIRGFTTMRYINLRFTYLLLLSFSFFPHLFSAVAYWMSTYFHTSCDLCSNLECRSEMCCTWLAENTARKKSPKIRHRHTIAQLCRAVSSQPGHVPTIEKSH